MKKFIYIAATSFLLFACANSNKEPSRSDIDFSETEVMGNNNMDLEETASMTSTDLATSKLRDYFELLLLEQKHPEFKEDIQSQIRNLTESDFNTPDSLSIISIENITHQGAIEQFGDSLQKIKFYFNLNTENGVQQDSITAILRTHKVMVDSEEVTATKVTFEKD